MCYVEGLHLDIHDVRGLCLAANVFNSVVVRMCFALALPDSCIDSVLLWWGDVLYLYCQICRYYAN